MEPPTFSFVIPAYNEASYLPRLLDTVDVARARYEGGADAIEVIVADNASTDATAQIAMDRGCRVTSITKRCIAAARNGGAAMAEGEFLCFCDADMRIHPETFNAVHAVMKTERYIAGATGVRLETYSPGILATMAVMLPMVWIAGMDTGVVFCRRKDFVTMGGYDESLYMAEDVRFLLDLRKLGRTHGLRLARATSAKALSSTRKWDEHGQWHYFRLMAMFFVMRFIHPQNADDFVQSYWYGDQRSPDRNSGKSSR